MKKGPVSFSPVRRQLLLGASGACALSVIPLNGMARIGTSNEGGLQAALGRFDEASGHWQPIGFRRGALEVGQPLQVVVRGPQAFSNQAESMRLAVSVVYHALPQYPFELGSEAGNAGHGGIVLHAAAGSLAGLAICRRGESASSGVYCALTHFLRPVLEPGHYAVMAGIGRHQSLPVWSALPAPDESGGLPVGNVSPLAMPLSVVSLRVTAV